MGENMLACSVMRDPVNRTIASTADPIPTEIGKCSIP